MQALKCGYNALMSVFSGNHASTIIEFITITRGGESGLLAVLNINEEPKYYELAGLNSLLKKYTSEQQQAALLKGIVAIKTTENLDEVPEFEGGLPVQASLF